MKNIDNGKNFVSHNKNFFSASTVATSSTQDPGDTEFSPIKSEDANTLDGLENFVTLDDFKKLQERLKNLEKNRV
jgi:hypothetical protein